MDFEIMALQSNKYVMESLHGMALDQPVSDRRGYVNAALESVSTNAMNSKLIGNLYKEISSFTNIDYGKIPESKGDLSKYKYYSQMTQCMDILNKLAASATVSVPKVNTMNKLHTILLDARDDFVFGYRMNIDLIQTTYQLLVLTLYEVINDVIVELADALKNVGAVIETKPYAPKSSAYVSAANKFIESYEKGEFAKIMKEYRKNSSNLLGSVLAGATGSAGTSLGILAAPGAAVAANVAIVLGILLALRLLIMNIYTAKTKIADYIRIQAEILKFNVENDINQSDTAAQKQAKAIERLEYLAGIIEGKRAKTKAKADKNIKESNKTNYSKKEVSAMNGLDFELV